MPKQWKVFNDGIGYVALIEVDPDGKEVGDSEWIDGEDDIAAYVNGLEVVAEKQRVEISKLLLYGSR